MGHALAHIGADWLADAVEEMADHIDHVTPVAYNEANRYLPQGVSPRPGYIRYDLFPFLVEIIECFDPMSPVREANLMKGVQVGYTTLLEAVLFFYIGHVKTAPAMFITADKELATARVENNILPMLNESDMGHLIRSADIGNSRKTGKTKDYLQWEGGGFLIPQGAQNAAKMRSFSVPLMLKDELDGWPRMAGKDGDSDKLTDARLSAYWAVRKILRGSTPTAFPSLIQDAYDNGDKRQYNVRCKSCREPQPLRMEWPGGGGFKWDLDENGGLILESVRYCCRACGFEHYEHDKERLFSAADGAHWEPTCKPKTPGVRSYHLPSFYSPFGFRPWYKCIADYLDAYDPVTKQVKSYAKLQEFYNNTLGVPFKPKASAIKFESVSAHRRAGYRLGEVPNKYAVQFAGSRVHFLTCTVDVHAKNLAVTVTGWTRDQRSFTVDYWRYEVGDGEDCSEVGSPVWGRLRALIEEKVYTADDGAQYRIAITLIDASYSTDTVVKFCAAYEAGVYPVFGRDQTAKNQAVKEFAPFTTQAGTTGYRILVSHYKDRLAPVLRRSWSEEDGEQGAYHFNAPVDITDKQLKELTVEVRKEKTDEAGNTSYVWHRPGNARNELWDLLVYGHCAVEIIAWEVCVNQFELPTVDWDRFWAYLESHKPYLTPPPEPVAT
jgi:phage terminase large subunit GpA-like protein